MAITIDATTNSGRKVYQSSITQSHTTAGTNRLLIVSVHQGDGSAPSAPSGVTYNGVSMTAGAYSNPSSGSIYNRTNIYYLVNPATGANNVVVSGLNSPINACVNIVSLNGVNQASPLDVASDAGGYGGSASATANFTTNYNNSLIVFSQSLQPNSYTITPKSGTLISTLEMAGSPATTANIAYVDGGTAGAKSVGFETFSSTVWGIVALAIRAEISGPTNLKSFNGLAKASIKSINSLAIGSIKSVNGLQ
jgi:hypothetical protein